MTWRGDIGACGSVPEAALDGRREFAKRAFDITAAFAGLVVLAPVMLAIAALIRLSDGGSVFYRQRRVGRYGREFGILKFRTMVPDADRRGPLVTGRTDPRITRVGRVLRRWKLDELPQLWNVLRGEMSFVGPRPEVAKYVARYTEEQRSLLSLKPGVTDLATLQFRNEEELLARAENVEEFYVRHCIPRKFELNMRYARRATFWTDLWVITATVLPRSVRMLLGHAGALAASLWAVYAMRSDFSSLPGEDFWKAALIAVPVQAACLAWRGQFRTVPDVFHGPEAREVAIALGAAALIQVAAGLASSRLPVAPAGVIAMHVLCAFAFIACGRRWLGHLRRRVVRPSRGTEHSSGKRIAIVGAGEAGAWVARQLIRGRRHGIEAFFDDDPGRWQRRLHGVAVVGMPECLLEGWSGRVEEVVIATPESGSERRSEVGAMLRGAGIRVRTLGELEDELC